MTKRHGKNCKRIELRQHEHNKSMCHWPVVFEGNWDEVSAYATEKGYDWHEIGRKPFGGYFRKSSTDRLYPY